jgi:hypothetical protein
MAAEVDAHAGDGVAGGGAADPVGALHERHAVAVAGGPVRGAHARGPCPEHEQVGLGRGRQPPAGTAAPAAAAG